MYHFNSPGSILHYSQVALEHCRTTNCHLCPTKWNESGFRPPLCTCRLNWARRTSWGWWDDWDNTGFEIQILAGWGRARYLSVTEAPHNTDFHTWMGRNIFCFFQTAATGNRTLNSGVKGSGANHYPRAPPGTHLHLSEVKHLSVTFSP